MYVRDPAPQFANKYRTHLRNSICRGIRQYTSAITLAIIIYIYVFTWRQLYLLQSYN